MDVAELRRWVDTRELMRRDRGNHRLKVGNLDELPTAVMKQVTSLLTINITTYYYYLLLLLLLTITNTTS